MDIIAIVKIDKYTQQNDGSLGNMKQWPIDN